MSARGAPWSPWAKAMNAVPTAVEASAAGVNCESPTGANDAERLVLFARSSRTASHSSASAGNRRSPSIQGRDQRRSSTLAGAAMSISAASRLPVRSSALRHASGSTDGPMLKTS